jgi:hypothetical protein
MSTEYPAMSDFDKGFVIGLIVGEGSFTGDKRQPSLDVRMGSNDPAPILFLRRIFGGAVYHYVRTAKDGRTRDFYDYHLRGGELKKSIRFFDEHMIQSRKRNQFEDWLDRYDLRAYTQGFSGTIRKNVRRRSTSRVDDAD